MNTIVVAMNQDGVIGFNGTIPWHVPEDFKHFKEYTMGKPLIMGRKTFESIGKALPGRSTIIITRDENYKKDNCRIAANIEEALSMASGDEVIIAGGGEIYKQILEKDLVDKLVVSVINTDAIIEGVTFPKIDEDFWKLVKEEEKSTFTLKIYERKNK